MLSLTRKVIVTSGRVRQDAASRLGPIARGQSLAPVKNKPVLALVLGAILYLVLLASIWDLEEPSKWNTMVCLGIVTLAAFALILLARRIRMIRSVMAWTVAFLLKLLVALLILKYSWMLPLRNMQRIETSGDQLAYDFHGKRLAEADLSGEVISNSVRGDGKAMFWYVGSIYYVFGISTLYVALVNCLWSLLTFLALAGILTRFHPNVPWDALRWGILSYFEDWTDNLAMLRYDEAVFVPGSLI